MSEEIAQTNEKLAVEIVGFTYIVKRFPILPPRTHTVRPGKKTLAAGLASGQGAG